MSRLQSGNGPDRFDRRKATPDRSGEALSAPPTAATERTIDEPANEIRTRFLGPLDELRDYITQISGQPDIISPFHHIHGAVIRIAAGQALDPDFDLQATIWRFQAAVRDQECAVSRLARYPQVAEAIALYKAVMTYFPLLDTIGNELSGRR